MEIPASLRALLLPDHQPLGLALGTPRAQLVRPPYFRPGFVDKWNFASGTTEGNEVAWTIDPGTGLLSEARVVVAPRGGPAVGLAEAIRAMFEGAFGKPRMLKRNEERAWTITAGLKSTLSVSVRRDAAAGAVIVVNLALAKGQKIEAVELPRQTSMKVPQPLETLLAKNFGVKLGSAMTEEETTDLVFSDARGGFPKKGKLQRQADGGKLHAVLLELPDFGDEEETHANAGAALLASLTARLGKPKSSKKSTPSQTRVESTWTVEHGHTLKFWSLDSCTVSQDVPNRTLGVEYRAAV
jgi:hypothetical protein